MPPLKQPTSLEKMATNVLVEYFIDFFRLCTCEESLDELREGVAFIKNAIRSRMPGKLAVKLYNEMLQEFVSPKRHDLIPNHRHVRIASELLFDDEITGVECLSVIIFSLEQQHLIRIRGITELEFSWKIPHSLEMLHLRDLTVFKYVEHCTDSDLATLSKQCEKLEHVNVSESREVTDVGLRALASCHNLRYVSVACCFKVTDVGLHALASCDNLHNLSVACCSEISLSGLIRFLSVNKTIRELFARSDDDDPGFDFRRIRNWDLDPTVYRSIESLMIAEDSSDRHLRSIVAKFPNLRSIKVVGSIRGNLSVLKTLSKLSKIDFYSDTIAGWTEFELLLESVGPQIHQLVLRHDEINDMQRRLDSTFRLCKNLESLHFECEYRFQGGKLVVPPFERIQYLKCAYSDSPSPSTSLYDMDDYMDDYMDDEGWTLDLSQMLMLENLQVDGFVIGENRVKSMIIDPMCFPNLKEMTLTEFWYNTNFSRVEQVVKQNNLHLKLEYPERSYDKEFMLHQNYILS